MRILRNPFWRSKDATTKAQTGPAAPASGASAVNTFDVDIAPSDPLLAYFASAPGVVEIDTLEMDSPALGMMKSVGVKLVVPLVSQGELIGLLNLGPRRSEQDYSIDDKRLLNTLAAQAAPSLRVAQLARQQQIEARELERVEQEMRVARVIQQTLLPDQTPSLEGWKISACWQPARAVSGDFYDFWHFPDGKLGIIVADVTDKGVPAALVMATARSLLRAAAERFVSPGLVLARANDLLCPDIPAKMFVTCLYILLDPASGDLTLANAGHNLPIRSGRSGVEDLHARGMPLGLMPGMPYDEVQAHLDEGDRLLLYSDGLVEGHNPQREMFGFPRLRQMVGQISPEVELIPTLMQALVDFTGVDWEQEDDVTLLTVERDPISVPLGSERSGVPEREDDWFVLAEFSLPSQPGNERLAMQQVEQVVQNVGLSPARIDRLKTAVAEATMNAMEHGNQYREDLPVDIQVLRGPGSVLVRIHDYGSKDIPEYVEPDLEAKLNGLQSPRGWGLFLVRKMVDEMRVVKDETHHTIELLMKLEE